VRHNDVVYGVLTITNTKIRDIADELGVKPDTIGRVLRDGRNVSIIRYADMLDVCGYKLVAMPKSCEVPQRAFKVDGTKED